MRLAIAVKFKKINILTVVVFGFLIQGMAENPNPPYPAKGKQIPDIPGYHTLKCDFHMHTIFSDGKVWPTVRVHEALQEGLDVIALSDHIGKQKPNVDVIKNLDRAYDIAAEEAKNTDLIVVKGAEITFPSPPGHFNALFLTEAQKLDTKEYEEAFMEAKKQDAFFIWNHSHWRSPNKNYEQDGIAQWTNVHQELFEEGMLMGMEIVNGATYNKEAHDWCMEKNLTLFGNTDIHWPITFEYDTQKKHRPITLVFAQERTQQSIKEALIARRTAVWFENNIIGDEAFLGPLFQEAVKVKKVSYYERIAEVLLENNSSVDFILENDGDYSFFNKTNVIVLKAGEKLKLGVKTKEVLADFNLKFKVLNMHVSPVDYLKIELNCTTNK